MLENEDELQSVNDEIETEYEEVEDAEPIEDDLSDSDSDPDSDTQHEVKEGEEQLDNFSKEKVNERFGKLTRERAEAERRAKEAEERLQELTEKQLQSSKPVIPDLPDPDEVSEREFQEALQRRDNAMREQLNWQQQVNSLEQQRQQQTYQEQQRKQQELTQTAQTYQQRAKALKVKPEELQQAAQVVNQVGLNDDLALHILQDEVGALITKHLGNNVQDLLEVASLNPVQAALYIEKNIKPKLVAPKRRSTTTKPPSRVKGSTPNRNEKFPLTGGRARFE